MNPLDFIDSEDIREYLQDIGFEVDTLLASYLVWQSEMKTLAEKHEAWRWIIENMPDMAVPKREFTEGWDSLHGMLEGYMCVEQELLKTYSKRKQDVWVKLNPNGDVVNIAGNISGFTDEMDTETWYLSFDGMWFDVPVPFKKGDLVRNVITDEVFVLEAISPWIYRGDNRNTNYYLGWTDMIAFGFSNAELEGDCRDDGVAGYDRRFGIPRGPYLQLEHYRGSLVGKGCMLLSRSKFLSGKLDAVGYHRNRWKMAQIKHRKICKAA